MKRAACVLLLGAIVASPDAMSEAQTLPQFEVASVRPNNSRSAYVTRPTEYPGGRFQAINVTFRSLVNYAFALKRPAGVSGQLPSGEMRRTRFRSSTGRA